MRPSKRRKKHYQVESEQWGEIEITPRKSVIVISPTKVGMKDMIQPKLKVWSELEITARLVIIDVISDYWWMFDQELDEITDEDMTEKVEITVEKMTGLDEVNGRARKEDDQEDHQVVGRKGARSKSQKITDWFFRPKVDLGVEKCRFGDVPHPKSGMGVETIGGEDFESEYDHWNAIDLVDDFLVDLIDDWWCTLVRRKKAAKKKTEWSMRNLITNEVLESVMTMTNKNPRRDRKKRKGEIFYKEPSPKNRKGEMHYRGERKIELKKATEYLAGRKRGLEGGNAIQEGGHSKILNTPLVLNNPAAGKLKKVWADLWNKKKQQGIKQAEAAPVSARKRPQNPKKEKVTTLVNLFEKRNSVGERGAGVKPTQNSARKLILKTSATKRKNGDFEYSGTDSSTGASTSKKSRIELPPIRGSENGRQRIG